LTFLWSSPFLVPPPSPLCCGEMTKKIFPPPYAWKTFSTPAEYTSIVLHRTTFLGSSWPLPTTFYGAFLLETVTPYFPSFPIFPHLSVFFFACELPRACPNFRFPMSLFFFSQRNSNFSDSLPREKVPTSYQTLFSVFGFPTL